MIRKLIVVVIVLAIVGFGAFWLITAPRTFAATDLPEHTPDVANGEYMFWAGGCASCHAAPGATGDDLLKLGGGHGAEVRTSATSTSPTSRRTRRPGSATGPRSTSSTP